jgi:hypothetical protein
VPDDPRNTTIAARLRASYPEKSESPGNSRGFTAIDQDVPVAPAAFVRGRWA